MSTQQKGNTGANKEGSGSKGHSNSKSSSSVPSSNTKKDIKNSKKED